jgi:hypothetical protein
MEVASFSETSKEIHPSLCNNPGEDYLSHIHRQNLTIYKSEIY